MTNDAYNVRSLLQIFDQRRSEGEIFAKILSLNDDSGRHGVVIPVDTYSFFPKLEIQDPRQNTTQLFDVLDRSTGRKKQIAYKYYQRYPERRLTRLGTILNERPNEPRLLIIVRTKNQTGHYDYYLDCINNSEKERFSENFFSIFGNSLPLRSGLFIVRPLLAETFSPDSTLNELLTKFDEIKASGWINSLRSGDTGIGYTFETMLGIKENNDQVADFKGIELKCKKVREGSVSDLGKVNLFQLGPQWTFGESSIERLRHIGRLNENGLSVCYSQVTTSPNNLGLRLLHNSNESRIDLDRLDQVIGYWNSSDIKRRLIEKHSRAAFVKAKTRTRMGTVQYLYEELIYCERPDVERFIEQLLNRRIVFEFTMSEKPNGSVRNHGYPWRLVRSEFLDQLFAFQIKLR